MASKDLLSSADGPPPPPPPKKHRKKHPQKNSNKKTGAYGFVHVPMAPGTAHDVDCLTWAPEGGALDRLRAFLWGGAPRLSDERAVACALANRQGLRTTTAGIVRLRLSVIAKDFARYNVSI